MLGIGLERVFRSPGQISVLRALWKAPVPVTGRQVQQLAGVHNLTAMRCLNSLERLGLLQKRSAGRAYLYSLKRSHRLVQRLVDPIFQAEENVSSRFAEEMAKILHGCLAAVVYGGVARGEASGSTGDVDLLIVVRNPKAAEQFTAGVLPKAEQLVREGWGLMLEANIKTRSQLQRSWNSPLMRRIRKEGRLVAGLPLERIRDGR